MRGGMAVKLCGHLRRYTVMIKRSMVPNSRSVEDFAVATVLPPEPCELSLGEPVQRTCSNRPFQPPVRRPPTQATLNVSAQNARNASQLPILRDISSQGWVATILAKARRHGTASSHLTMGPNGYAPGVRETATYKHTLRSRQGGSSLASAPALFFSRGIVVYTSHTLALALVLVSHGDYLARRMAATRNRMSTAMHPSLSLSLHLPRPLLASNNTPLRARTSTPRRRVEPPRAHLNSLEVFPLSTAAVVAGGQPRRPARARRGLHGAVLPGGAHAVHGHHERRAGVRAHGRVRVGVVAIPMVVLWRAGIAVA